MHHDVTTWWPRRLPTAPPFPPPMVVDDVHVWTTSLEIDRGLGVELAGALTASERLRASRFRDARDAADFVVRRGFLRTVLAAYLVEGTDPATVSLAADDNGKPQVAGSDLRFNLASTARLAVCAVTWSCEVGIDVESIVADLDYEMVAALVCTGQEREQLHALPRALRRRRFYACWARKEAVVKAAGDGLRWPLHQLDVSCLDRPRALVRTGPDGLVTNRWWLRDLDVGAGYAAALATAVPGRDERRTSSDRATARAGPMVGMDR